MYPDFVIQSCNNVFIARDPLAPSALIESSDASTVIQAALDALGSRGGSISLRSGNYLLARPLRMTQRAQLAGTGRATRLVVANAQIEGEGIQVKGVDGFVVRDLMVTPETPGGGRSGVVLSEAGDGKLEGLYLHGFSTHGLALRAGCFLITATHCTAAGNGRSGFYATKNSNTRVGDFVPMLFQGCTAYGGGTGFELENAIVANFVGCIAYQTNSHGFHFHLRSNSVVVSGCRTFQVGGNALFIENTHEIHAVGNIFCWQRDHGIVVRDACWGVIVGNNVIDSGTRTADGSLRHGIFIDGDSKGITVSANSVFNWGDQPCLASGIVEAETCAFNNFVANNLNDTTETDILSQGTHSVAADNLSAPERAHVSADKKPYPDFNTNSLQKFIAEQ